MAHDTLQDIYTCMFTINHVNIYVLLRNYNKNPMYVYV